MKRKRETIEEVIRMASRVQMKMAREGIALRFTVYFEPCPPTKNKRRPQKANRRI